MKHNQLVFNLMATTVIAALGLAVYTKTVHGQSWELLHHSPAQGKVEFIEIHPDRPTELFIGAANRLYRSTDEGKTWNECFRLGGKTKINRLYMENERLILLTSEGVFESRENGKRWNEIFSGLGPKERNALGIARDPHNPNGLYLGTEGGLFESRDDGKTWTQSTNELANDVIRDLQTDLENGEVFIASSKGLYRAIPRKKRLDRVFGTRSVSFLENGEAESSEETEEPDSEPESKSKEIHAISIAAEPSVIAAGTTDGVLISEDEGNRWERLPANGLQGTDVLDLAYSKQLNTFFAATEKGVFCFDPKLKHWKELYEGLPKAQANRLKIVHQQMGGETLYAATDAGLYKIEIQPDLIALKTTGEIPLDRLHLLRELFRQEPSISSVQNQAIRYANVANAKTKRWQWGSRLRALIPSFSIGKSFGTNTNIDLDRGGTADADKFIAGPVDEDSSLDFDLEWDLADLIWNSAQTSIDSREKLMIELRNDILSEVTRLYFERRRAQTEFVLNAPQEAAERVNALLRIDELTASIDLFTNGYLIESLERLYAANPALYEIWSPIVSPPEETE